MNDVSAMATARLKDRRVLVVSNLLNGLPVWQVARDFRLEANEVDSIFKFAMCKVKDYIFRHCKPPIFCETVEEARKDRVNILAILPKLNLDKEPEHKKIVTEKVTDKNHKSIINDNLRRKS